MLVAIKIKKQSQISKSVMNPILRILIILKPPIEIIYDIVEHWDPASVVLEVAVSNLHSIHY